MSSNSPLLELIDIELFERPVHLRLPFKFGVVTLTHCPQAFVRVQVRTAGGKIVHGGAAEVMAPKWFDKNLALSNEDNFNQLRDVLRIAKQAYLSDKKPATSFEHFARHYDAQKFICAQRGYNSLLANYGPALIDRAILDALCRAHDVSFYKAVQHNLIGISSQAGKLQDEFASLGVAQCLSDLKPAPFIEARHTVGMLDPITSHDIQASVNDGLPESLEDVVKVYGHRFFKLKVGGNLHEDLNRLKSIASVLDGIQAPYFASLDGNEQYESAEQLQELLSCMRSTPELIRLMSSVLFVEQPVNRKMALEADFRGNALGLPVIIDESDDSLDSFVAAREQGYSGVSSKSCKGLYKSFLNAARCSRWNAEQGPLKFFMSAEDLTTQSGLSVQQDLALVNLLGITHVERNGHHYVNGMAALPESEQQAFLSAHPDVYERTHGAVRLQIRNGRIALSSMDCVGFGSSVLPEFQSMKPIELNSNIA
jgi:hypothetical protein